MTDDKSVSIEMRRCPNCGASDVSTNTETGKLRCNYCKHDFDDTAVNSDTPDKTFENAKGDIVSSGASNIIPGQDVIVTFKCPSCGGTKSIKYGKDGRGQKYKCKGSMVKKCRQCSWKRTQNRQL